MSKFYITIAIPYVNGKPHIGHALEYFQADTIRKFHQINGDETLLLSGADENALKNVQEAEKEQIPVQEFLDRNSQVFKDAFKKLGVNLDIFQRGSDKKLHWPGVQKLWQLCEKNGDIYKKIYLGHYCVGCESFKTEKELTTDGVCPIHLKKPEEVNEKNYFFRLSKYQESLIELIESNKLKITPQNKRAEALSFIKSGLEDFSVSRTIERAKGVGVPVPGDRRQIIYVWFDALLIYLTGIGYGSDENLFKKWWPADLQIIGKDINRFHTVYLPAMLLSANLPPAKQILIHSFINAPGGQKMSKTLGNVIDPFEMVAMFGLEPLRYFLLSQIPLSEDGEASIERFKEVYNADLANGLGNLISRVARLCENSNFTQLVSHFKKRLHLMDADEYIEKLSEYRFSDALALVWKKIATLDKFINEEKPWELLKNNNPKIKDVLAHAVDQILEIALLLQPLMPQTAEKIEKQFTAQTIKSLPPLFPRI